MPLGAYIHIPFCAYKCHFCDFVTSTRTGELQNQYCQVLGQEIKGRLEELPSKPTINTIFYGGGTPGILDMGNFIKVHQTLLSSINLSSDNEISLETTPETVSKEKVKLWHDLGINRLSIGVQSLNDCELISLGRGHTVAQTELAIKNAVEGGFENINCDLMYGLPMQNLPSWRQTLISFIKLAGQYPQIKHLSAYGLELSPGAPLSRIHPANSSVYPSEERFIELFEYLVDTLSTAGFNQYEISNFAKPGYYCQHNISCWQQSEYHAFGVSAHRFIKPYRSSNWRSLTQYLNDYLSNETCEFIDKQTSMKEAIMLGLRMTEGIDLNRFKQTFDFDFEQIYARQIDNLITLNLLIYENSKLKLTIQGQPVANSVITEFL